MKIKGILTLFAAASLGLCLCGCARSDCMLTVMTYYGGCGIDGKELDSGSFSSTYAASVGDAFYEDYSGHWHKGSKDDYDTVLVITGVTEDAVTVQSGDTEITIMYDSTEHIGSNYVVYDGTNYEYDITVTHG